MNKLTELLRKLAASKHDDLSIAEKAADRIDELEEALRPFTDLFLYPDDLGFEMSEDIKSDQDWDEDANDMTTTNVFVLRRDIRNARNVLNKYKQ